MIDTYINQCYKHGRILLQQKCHKAEMDNPMVKVTIEDINTRSTIYHFYKNGKSIRTIKYFLGNMWGGNDTIMLSNNFSSGSSYNGIYQVKFKDGKVVLQTMMGHNLVSVEEMVEHIWKEYIEIYLRY